MTHAELVDRAARWLRSQGCSIVFAELVAALSETPDAIGWRNGGGVSYLIECKTSRSDFLADRHKPHRRDPTQGMGAHRYFLCPPGMIRVDDLPPGWGLLYCHPKRITLEAGQSPKSYHLAPGFHHQPNRVGEMRMMASALNRLRIDMGDAEFHRRVHLSFDKRNAERNAPTEGVTPESVHDQNRALSV